MQSEKKGVILAGGTGSRLSPVTSTQSKQLLPIFDKPMIYYPLATLMSAGIKEICIIVNPHEEDNFRKLLGDGSSFGININFVTQPSPDGIAQAYILAEEFLDGKQSCLVLGDNVFVGGGLGEQLSNIDSNEGAKIFLYEVQNPRAYGNVKLNKFGEIESIIEKPKIPLSKYAIPGIYFMDGSAPRRAHKLGKSDRGEIEITDLLNTYLIEGSLESKILSRGTAWLDTGTPEDLFAAGELIRVLQARQGVYIACLEEIALRNGWIEFSKIERQHKNIKSSYSKYVLNLGCNN